MNHFFTESKNIERDSYLWNIAFSVLQAFQSVILLMVMTRTVGLTQAGIFTIAYANANLFLNIGKYGMRYYQVSDVKGQYSFGEYISSRVISTIMMIIVAILYISYAAVLNNYSFEKAWTIIWMCLYKSTDAIEDVFAGYYQQRGRLDVASKVLSVRNGLTVSIFVGGIIILHNMLYALIITTLMAYILMIVFLYSTYGSFRSQNLDVRPKQVICLMRSCFPLCIGSFLSFYIGNAPKYAIDAQLSDELLACYGFIAMPVFVVELLNVFIYNPILYKLAIYWQSGNVNVFVRHILMQIGCIILITIVCMSGAWLVGIPILSWMYHIDLSLYKIELLILLGGGGFLGMVSFFNAMITIIRCQKSIAYVYGGVAILAFFLCTPVVRECGIMGAAILYTALMGGVSLCFGGILIWGILKKRVRR